MSKKQERKNKVRAFPIMLILTAILLVASTYAWFIANQTVRVNSLELGVDKVAGLQISTDAVNWRAEIDSTVLLATNNGTDYAGAKNQLPAVNTTLNPADSYTIKPVSSPGTVTDGKLNMFEGALTVTEDGEFAFTTTAATETKTTALTDNTNNGNFYAFDIFLKADQAMNIDLDSTASVKAVAKSGSGGSADVQLESASRVAFVNLGNYSILNDTTGNGTLENIQGLNGTVGDSNVGHVYMWEPYADMHKPYLGIAAVSPIVKTNAVKAAFSNKTLTALKDTEDTTNFVEIGNTGTSSTMTTTGNLHYLSTLEAISEGGSTIQEDFIALSEGVTKFRCYVWIEGQDVDCNNDITGSTVQVDISFTREGQTPRS